MFNIDSGVHTDTCVMLPVLPLFLFDHLHPFSFSFSFLVFLVHVLLKLAIDARRWDLLDPDNLCDVTDVSDSV